jgi:hypothetical protein
VEAADVVADTMLVAWRRIDDVPPEPGTRLWLFGVARQRGDVWPAHEVIGRWIECPAGIPTVWEFSGPFRFLRCFEKL